MQETATIVGLSQSRRISLMDWTGWVPLLLLQPRTMNWLPLLLLQPRTMNWLNWIPLLLLLLQPRTMN